MFEENAIISEALDVVFRKPTCTAIPRGPELACGGAGDRGGLEAVVTPATVALFSSQVLRHPFHCRFAFHLAELCRDAPGRAHALLPVVCHTLIDQLLDQFGRFECPARHDAVSVGLAEDVEFAAGFERHALARFVRQHEHAGALEATDDLDSVCDVVCVLDCVALGIEAARIEIEWKFDIACAEARARE